MPRLCEDWLQSYMYYTQPSESPDSFHFWTGVSTIAGALRRKARFNQITFEWSPNFYIILVAPPGIAAKSTSISIGMSMLEEVKGIVFGPNAMTWQYLPTALAEARVDYPENGGFAPMCCLTFQSSELGTLLDPRDREMIDLLVDMWDGKIGVWKKQTKTQGGDEVVNPWINIIACTTPSWVAENFPKTLVGGGFVSRCIFVYEEKKRQYVAYPKKLYNSDTIALRSRLVHDLGEIAEITGEYELDKEAEEFGEEWYKNHWEHFKSVDDRGQQGFAARMQCHAHKLAMVLTAAKNNQRIIRRRELEAACALVENLESKMPKVFKAVDTSRSMAEADKVIEFVEKYGRVRKNVLYKTFMHMFSSTQFEEILTSCIRAGYMVPEQTGSDVFIRAVSQPKKEVV